MEIIHWLRFIIYKLFVEDSKLQGYVAHIPHGVVNIILAIYVHWTAALLFGSGFIIFELVQQWNYKDKASDDLAGWLLGMALAGIAYWLIGVF